MWVTEKYSKVPTMDPFETRILFLDKDLSQKIDCTEIIWTGGSTRSESRKLPLSKAAPCSDSVDGYFATEKVDGIYVYSMEPIPIGSAERNNRIQYNYNRQDIYRLGYGGMDSFGEIIINVQSTKHSGGLILYINWTYLTHLFVTFDNTVLRVSSNTILPHVCHQNYVKRTLTFERWNNMSSCQQFMHSSYGIMILFPTPQGIAHI